MKIIVIIFYILIIIFSNSVYLYSKEEVFIYKSEGRRDPFSPLITPDGRIIKPISEKKGITEFYLEGIMYDPKGGSFVIINNEIYKKDDIINGYTIVEINEDSVVFVKDSIVYDISFEKKSLNEGTD